VQKSDGIPPLSEGSCTVWLQRAKEAGEMAVAERRRGVSETRRGNVVIVRKSSFLRALDRDLASLGLTRKEFVREGKEGTFTSERARALWSMVGPDLLVE
jgi:hypothetical protein